jgi:predicted ATP-dependent endonuclease of OLD family
MRLLYVYIKHFRNFRDQEVRFVDDYDINYSGGKLSVRHTAHKRELEYLYGDNVLKNLTVIVGKTGAGKTNLLQLIGKQSYYREEDSEDEYFLLYELESPKHFVVESMGIDIQGLPVRKRGNKKMFQGVSFTINEAGAYVIDKGNLSDVLGHSYIFNSFDNHSYAYCPYGMTKEDRRSSSSPISNTIPRELSIYGETSVSIECELIRDYVYQFPEGSIKRQAAFVIRWNNWHDKLNIELSEWEENRYWTYHYPPYESPYDPDVSRNNKKVVKPHPWKKKTSPKKIFLHDFLTDFAIYLRKYIKGYFHPSRSVSLEADCGRNKRVEKRLDDLCKFIDLNISENQYEESFVWQEGQDIIDVYHLLSKMDDKYFTEDSFSIPVEEIDTKSENSLMRHIFENIENYVPDEQGLFPDQLIPYHWDKVSSGEYQYGKVLADIDELANEMKVGNRGEKYEDLNHPNIILLMDEPETFMHPEMCRRFIDNIGRLLTKYHPEATLQLIITSHSPFMLSDVLSSQVIKINFDDMGYGHITQNMHKPYFAANIHTIMADGFFLEYTIGERSRKFLQEKVHWLQDLIKSHTELSKEDAQEVLHLRDFLPYIGDDMIRHIISNMIELLP